MPVLPTLSTKNYGRRGKDEDAQTRLLSDDEHLARSKQQMAPSPPPPFLESSESDSESGQHRPAQSEPHHSPAGYRTPPGEKQQHDPLPLPSQQTFSVPYERVPDADAAHRAALKRRSQHQQPQQQILPGASQARLQTQQRGEQAAQSSQTSAAQRPASRAQPVVPPLPRLASDSSATSKIDESRRIPMVKRRPSPSLAVPTMPATATTTDAGEAAGAKSHGTHEKEAPHQPFNLWGAVDGAAAALARLRIGVPHAPIVVTPTTAPIGFTFEEVDGHHSDDAAFHNPPDAAAVAESEAARRTETTAANAATAEANPRSRVLDALVAGISRFGVLGIHHPVWFW